jgi:hypothetical protein
MIKYKTLLIGFVLGIVATSAIRCDDPPMGLVGPTEAGASPSDASATGRYQISTTSREGRYGIFETIINTETGEVVRRKYVDTDLYIDYP